MTETSQKLATFLDGLKLNRTLLNSLGNTVYQYFHRCDRYIFDFGLCETSEGWCQYDTSQDASYHGIWVNLSRRQIFKYLEGDLELTCCIDAEHLRAELDHLECVYGDAPPAFAAISSAGIEYAYDERPSI